MSAAARPASLQGSLGELALPDVLQLLDLGRKTGVLVVRHAGTGTDGAVVLVDGRVAGAASRAPGDAESQGALVARALRHPVRATEAAVYEALGWDEGSFAFAPLDPSLLTAARAGGRGVSVDALLLEAARRDDEWARLSARIPHLGLVPALAEAGGAAGAPLALSPEEWTLLAVVDGERDLRTLAAALGTDPLAVARAVDALVTAGVLALGVPEGEPRSSSRERSLPCR